MTPEELEKAKEVENAVYLLIDLNIVETTAIDEDGNFCYGLTKHGTEVAEELKKRGLLPELGEIEDE